MRSSAEGAKICNRMPDTAGMQMAHVPVKSLKVGGDGENPFAIFSSPLARISLTNGNERNSRGKFGLAWEMQRWKIGCVLCRYVCIKSINHPGGTNFDRLVDTAIQAKPSQAKGRGNMEIDVPDA